MNAKNFKSLAIIAASLAALFAVNSYFGFAGTAGGADRYVLAVSWQPAFCEGAQRKPECRSQTQKRFDADHFALHGLWPQPGTNLYCGVGDADRATDKRGRWRDLPGLGLSKPVQEELVRVMPGTQSYLHRHEWVKHGTCYSDSPERYFRDSLILMQQINASAVRDLFAHNTGRHLSAKAIRNAFDRSFGEGAGDRVKISCRRDGQRQLITEFTVGLAGEIGADTPIADLIAASPDTGPGCPGGVVDPVGFQ